jgi:CheY-like chemotaxis protein
VNFSPEQSHRFELLIVDDDAAFRDALRSILEPQFQLVEAECGEQALEIVERRPIDLAVLDMHMRRLTGLETLRQVRTIRPVFPAILITAQPTPQICEEAAQLDVYRVLPKPVPRRDLESTITSALRAMYPDRVA